MPDIVIEATGLRRSFGELAAVDGIDLQVERGQFYGFLGPNGAGKSTTIKMLTGMLRPTAGVIRILGVDLQQDPVEVKRRIGVVPEGLALFERLTGTQLLNFVGRMYGLSRETAAERALTNTPPLREPPSNLQRAVSALRATLPIVHQLLPILGGTLGAAVSNVLGPYPQTAPHTTPMNLEPIEDDVAELQTQHRDLRNRLLEHHASLKRVEDQLDRKSTRLTQSLRHLVCRLLLE